MTLTEQKVAAKKFAAKWADRGDEKQDTRSFWEEFMGDVLGIEGARDIIDTEYPVDVNGHQKYIDVLYKKKKILIEQKSAGKSLDKRYAQSGGDQLTPYEQGRRYAGYLAYDERPRWIVTCNFQQFEIHDMKKPSDPPEVVELSKLDKDISLFRFFVSDKNEDIKRETDISKDAGTVVGRLYDALLSKYIDPKSAESQRYLNILVTRLVFCMYAEDAGLFGDNTNRFQDYIRSKSPEDINDALERLFRILDTPYDVRAKKSNIPDSLNAFPYVNGGLFKEEDIEIPIFDESLKTTLVEDACAFNWAEISPTIFGAVFESTLNPETRRSGGMVYTSIENIHKVIDPLFLEELNNEFRSIKATSEQRGYRNRLVKFQEKLASIKFLDPACGSGNFLTETYLSLRRLENQAIGEYFYGQQTFGDVLKTNPIRVSIDQFYGIEINDFAVTVSKTALWIAEAQMLVETEEIIRNKIEFFPLKTNATIVEGNALQLDWNTVISKEDLNYIMGNPPFVGYSLQSDAQKEDIRSLYVDPQGKPYKAAGKIDYVAGWFWKSSEYIKNTKIRAALVSTNSITQGEQVAGIWQPLYERFGIHIDYAYRTFRWDSEANVKAHVHCVIIGFSTNYKPKAIVIYDKDDTEQTCAEISPYLIDSPTVWIHSRNQPLKNVPEMVYGNKPTDGGNLFLTEEEYLWVKKAHPDCLPYIKQILGATEYINNKKRYCLWLVNVSPSEIKRHPFIYQRVEAVKDFRSASKKEATRKSALTPSLFQEIRQPSEQYIIVPRHSSQSREYIPFGFIDPEVIVNDAVQIIPNAPIEHFGIMMSSVHMDWTRAVCGRIKSDYRYSKDIVYNNFVWVDLNDKQKEKIKETAQRILDARAKYPDASCADLYDKTLMPIELRKAHEANDKAVMEAYGFYHIGDHGRKQWYSEEETVAALMKMYQKLTQPDEIQAPKKAKATVKVKVHKKK